jgi:CBS domain-containing protein
MAVTAAQVMGASGDDVATVDPGALVRDAADVLSTRRIGAVVVVDDQRRVVGILSERDVVARLASDGGACLDLEVAELMSRTVTTSDGTETTEDLMALMTARRFRHVPVVDDDGVLVGIVSVGDVVKATIERLRDEKGALESYVTGGY